jgi:hypothetical protein
MLHQSHYPLPITLRRWGIRVPIPITAFCSLLSSKGNYRLPSLTSEGLFFYKLFIFKPGYQISLWLFHFIVFAVIGLRRKINLVFFVSFFFASQFLTVMVTALVTDGLVVALSLGLTVASAVTLTVVLIVALVVVLIVRRKGYRQWRWLWL